MLAQKHTEKFLELLTSRGNSAFERRPIKENAALFGFRPLTLADFAKKNVVDQSPEEETTASPNLEGSETAVDDISENFSGSEGQAEANESGECEIETVSEADENRANVEQSQEIRQEAYQEGYSAGFAAAESASEADIAATVDSLNKILKATEQSDVFNKEYIKEFIVRSIAEETSEYIGFCIDEMPEKFYEKIKSKVDRFSYLTEKKVIQINSKDFALIEEYCDLYRSDQFEFAPRDDLDRGSIVIQVGNINYQD